METGSAVLLLILAVAAEALLVDLHLLQLTEQADKEMPAGRHQVLDLFTVAVAVVRVLSVRLHREATVLQVRLRGRRSHTRAAAAEVLIGLLV